MLSFDLIIFVSSQFVTNSHVVVMITMWPGRSWEQELVVHNLNSYKTMQRSGRQYWGVRNSSGVALVFRPDAEHENDSVTSYQRSTWPHWTNKPLFVVLQRNRVWVTNYGGNVWGGKQTCQGLLVCKCCSISCETHWKENSVYLLLYLFKVQFQIDCCNERIFICK